MTNSISRAKKAQKSNYKETSSTTPNSTLSQEHSFPTEIFPQSIQNLITNAKETVGFNPDYLSAGILSSCATAIGNSVRLFNGSYESPSICWLATIGRSGDGKTHAMTLAKKPIEKKDKQKYQVFEKQLITYNTNQDDKCQKPTYAKSILGDYTPEKLLESLKHNEKGVLIFKDELIGWIKSFDRYRNGGDQQMYLELFNGNSVSVDRISKAPIRIESSNVNVLGGMQPSALKVMAAKNRNEDGFLARFLFVYAENTKPNLFTGNSIEASHIEKYEKLISKLFNCERMVLNASPSQIEIYKEWQHEKSKKYHNDDIEALVQSKLETYVWRLALIIEMMNQAVENNFTKSLSDVSIRKAIKLVEYFRENAHKVHNKVSSNDPLDKLPQKQVNLFDALSKEFKRSEAKEKGEQFGIRGGSLARFLNLRELFTRVDNEGNYKKNF